MMDSGNRALTSTGLLICFLVLLLGMPSGGAAGLEHGGYTETGISVPALWISEAGYLRLSSDLMLTFSQSTEQVDLDASIRFLVDPLSRTQDIQDTYRVVPDEITLTLYLDSWDLRVGYQRFSWGRADGINPSDLINPLNMSSLSNLGATEREERILPVIGAGLTWYITDSLIIEGVYLPSFTPPLLPPLSDSLPETLSGTQITLTYPEIRPDTFEAGLRMNFLTSVGDGSLSYFYGYDEVPSLRAETTVQDMGGYEIGVLDTLRLWFDRVHILAGDVAIPLKGVDLRGEAAFIITQDLSSDDVSVRNPFLHYTLSAGYTFFESVRTTFSFSQKIIIGYEGVSDYPYSVQLPDQDAAYYDEAYTILFSPLVSTQRAPVMNSITTVMSTPLFSDYLELSVLTMYNFPEEYQSDQGIKLGDLLLSPSLTWQVADALEVEGGAHLFLSYRIDDEGTWVSDPSTTFGMADAFDQVYLKARYSF